LRRRVGVIVGRFQVAQLHEGHRDLIEFVQSQCDEMMIVLGEARAYPTERNPLPFEARAAMIRSCCPNEVRVEKLYDHPSDHEWSRNLDNLIEGLYPGSIATLYGSRDSFAGHYSGNLPYVRFESKHNCDGTTRRRDLARKPSYTSEFLEGMIAREISRPPIVYQTVDIAVIRQHTNEVLLAGKFLDCDKLRFIGGFVDKTDESLERAARREVIEETSHIEVDNFRYLGSMQVDDWRYRNSKDGIMTAFFCADYIFGCPRPSDDIARLEWVKFVDIIDVLVPEHLSLGEKLQQFIAKERREKNSA
jgi:bifunctional NMN adenylyltransferase/nudix hydrolase